MGNYVVFFFLAINMKLRLLCGLSILLSLWLGNSYAMTFSAPKHEFYDVFAWENSHSGKTRIYADGEITDNTAQEFKAFVMANKIENAMVLLNSGGGSLVEGMRLGSAIRELGFDTGIATYSNGKMIEQGTCASACAYAFAGGIGRNYLGKGTRLGIHQFYSADPNVSNQASQEVSGLIVAYLQKMGVDAFAFSAASFVGKENMLWLTVEDAEKLQFANDGAFPTTAELKQSKTDTYLKVEQRRINGTARLLFFCNNKHIALTGGLVTTEEDAKNKDDWATRTYLNFDNNTIQLETRTKNPKGFNVSGSVAWVTRTLTGNDLNKLMSSKLITVGIGSDGAMAYVGNADITKVKDKIGNFINNCIQ
ncbi:hypothetical protein [Glaciimonas sp. PCH181]|uniref:COG3904 family protein n=1 Tax=Glaciimonas sp. PCH181 TaxID=2133943 RepID=UPI000D370248|nr:hypothetical protein [Glaciimonas sp. PCH181]PUA17811.1 hypothetical protein C7W93_18295 [Glaciimonas sp. PCH181]